MEYCLYLRKSRADLELELRGEFETLARHETTLIELGRKLGLNITKIYKEVVSGETIASRPVAQQLLQEVESGMWAGVLVMEVERLARGDTIDQGIMAQAFKYSNTKIITPGKTYDPNNEFDEEYFEFGLFMSRREYKSITRRIQRGRIASAKEGKFLSSTAPYGYNKVRIKNDKGFTLEINPEQADVVKLIYELYTKGEIQEDGTYRRLGMTVIARKLDILKIKPLKSDVWSRTSISDILQNPTYIGKIRWQYRKEVKKVVDGVLTVTRPNSSDPILVDGLHPAIIDEDTFKKAQVIMKTHANPSVRTDISLRNPLAGIVFCELCGTRMTRLGKNTKTPYDALKCPNRYCKNVSAPIFLVEQKILEVLEEFLKKYKLEIESKNVSNPVSLVVKQKAIVQIEEEISTINKQIDTTYNLLEQGVYTTDVFVERHQALNIKLNELKKSCAAAKKMYEDELKYEKSKSSIIPSVEKVLDLYHYLDDPLEKNELLKYVIEKTTYKKEKANTRGKLLNDNFIVKIYPKLP